MKKLISLLCVLALFLCMVANPAWASEDHYIYEGGYKTIEVSLNGGTLYFADRRDSVALFDSRGLSGDVVIPETVNGKPVTALVYFNCSPGLVYNLCLSKNQGITSITLPSTLKELKDMGETDTCFFSSDTLKRIEFLGDGPEVFPRKTFSECENLEEIIFPRKAREVSDSLNSSFISPPNLKKIVVPSDSLYLSMDDQGIIYNKDKTVLVSAAQGAQNRTEVTIPDTVQEIKEHAFQYNTKLEKLSGGKNLVRGNFSPGECGEEFNPFLDTYGHWSEESAKWAFQTGTISGMTPVTFCPDKKLNRGMFVTMLNRAVRGGTVSGGLIFTDVPLTAYYRVPLKWAVACKVVTGVGGTRFAPEQNVTREQMAAMIYRYVQNDKGKRHGRVILDEEGMIQGQYYYELDYKSEARGDLTVFTDADRISSYAEEAMSWAVGTGILQGKNGGRLDPKGTATRAEAVTMIQRLEELEEEINIEKD